MKRLSMFNSGISLWCILRDQNDTNEVVSAQMEAISESLAELATKVDDLTIKKPAPRNQIGFAAAAKRYEEETKKKAEEDKSKDDNTK